MDIVAKNSDTLKNGLSLAQAREYVNSLDLISVVNRLVNIDGWSNKSSFAVIKQYKNFLYLKKKYGNQYPLPPSYEIDEAWHAHILHTEQYVEFCLKFFGYYLHHHPHFSVEASSLDELNKLYEDTQHLYYEEFGEYIYKIRKKSLTNKLNKIFFRFTDRAITKKTKEVIL